MATAATAGLGLGAIGYGLVGLAGDRSTPSDLGTTAAAPSPYGVGGALPAPRTAPANSPTVSGARVATTGLPPAYLTVAAIGLRAVVLPVQSRDGSLAVPDDPSQVGWWDAGAAPGSPAGSVVLDGHVDTTAGPGALFRLTQLKPGDTISLTTTGQQRLTYAVTGRRIIRKAAGLPGDLFATTGAPRLVLITCGGPFNRRTHSYQDNIVVFATPT